LFRRHFCGILADQARRFRIDDCRQFTTLHAAASMDCYAMTAVGPSESDMPHGSFGEELIMNEREVFDAALAIADSNERSSYLDRACGSDLQLRNHLRGLVEAHEKLGGFLQRPLPVGEVTVLQPCVPKVGVLIAGRYKLLEQIGEGGMGAVWVAEQTEPVKRRVALKLIKPGMDTRQVLSRFEAERQALALMDHPNIARVFDGGMTDEGRPYFVMEYVKGLPLTQYCDDTRLTVVERLALFTQVCQAVQHAHQKGIIHRDLKPSNILVCLYDGQPVPKVIDFGLAKAMHQSLTEHTLYTAHGLMVGTPLYMSPEQAEFNNLDIDTRSDIYSLGVILYELLTGTTPLEKRQFKDAAWQEMVRLIKEEEPPRPSTRLSGSGSLPTLAAQRQLEPARLTKTVRGDLDWIVMKALEKDRSRRYETANGLARDVQRYLVDEPVEACPPSTSYRVRKFARRNMRALATAVLVGVMLFVVVGAVAGSLGWMARDREARQVKLAARLELILDEVKQQEAEQNWPEALAAARRAEALLAGGGGDAHLVRQANEVLADLKLVERLGAIRLDAAAHHDRFEWTDRAFAAAFREAGVDLDTMTTDDAVQRLRMRRLVVPVLSVTLDHWTLLRSLSGNAERGRALSAVAGQLDPDPWRQRQREAVDQIDTNVFVGDGAVPGKLARNAVEAAERLAASPDLLRQPPSALYRLGGMLTHGAAKPEVGATVLRKAHAQYPGDFWIITGLAESLESMGAEFQDEALGFRRAALALRPAHSGTWFQIGWIQQFHRKDLVEANACYRKAIDLDPTNSTLHNQVGAALQRQQKLPEAVACYHKAIELDPKNAWPHSNLGSIYRAQKKLDEAVASYRKALEIDPKHCSSYFGLGQILLEQNQVDEAVVTLTKALELTPRYPNLWWALGRARHKQKKLDEAVACFHKALELDSKPTNYHWGLAFALRDQKKTDEAVAAFRKAIAIEPTQAYATYGLGLALLDAKQKEEATTVFRKAVELEPTRADAHNQLGKLLAEQGKMAEALACFRKAVELAPNSAWNQTSLAWHLTTVADSQLRDPATAVIHARKATELQPDNAMYWSNLGVALLRAGDYKSAIEALEKVEEMTKGNTRRSGFVLAMAYWHLDERQKSRQVYEQAARRMDENQQDDEDQRRFRTEAAQLLGIAVPADVKPQ
jgi:tetratricopeptide (TPR) repeat protein/tRNA A-37 threonylcarbamoyl transferase component Bud32